MSANDLVTTVQGSAAKPYEIRETADPNVLWCSCPAWRNSKAKPKTCKHIKGLDISGDGVKAAVVAAALPDDPFAGIAPTEVRKPMRMESVEPGDAQVLFESGDWVVEQKVDGTRCVITVSGTNVTFAASNGEALKHSASLIHLPALKAALPAGDYILDGELLWTGEYWAFDCLAWKGENFKSLTLYQRRHNLETLFDLEDFGSQINLLPQARGLGDKVALFKAVYEAGGEGVILKHSDKSYEYGKRVTHQLKLKFTKTVDCIVTARNVNGKTNARLAVYDPNTCVYCDGPDADYHTMCQPKLREIGGCSMNGKPNAKVGDVVEVKYLYATEELDIYQPSLLRIRDDKAAEDCLIDQLRPVSKKVLSEV